MAAEPEAVKDTLQEGKYCTARMPSFSSWIDSSEPRDVSFLNNFLVVYLVL